MKLTLFFVASLVVAGTAGAAQPATATSPDSTQVPQVPVAKTAGSTQIGRLFFTPAERAQLDLARMQKKVPAPAAGAEPVEPTPPPQIVSYSGIVRRSNGKATLWINNRMVEEKDALAGLSLRGKVRPDGAVTLQVPQSGGTIDVKVGQSVELQSGRIAETRKSLPEAKAPADEAPPATAEPKPPIAAEPKPPAAAEPKPPAAVAVRPPAPERAEQKSASGPGVGLKMDLGGGTAK